MGFYLTAEVWRFVIQYGASTWRTEAAACQGQPPSSSPSPHPEAKRSLCSSASSTWLSAWYQWIISCAGQRLRSVNSSSSSTVTKCVFSFQANWIEGAAYSLLLLLDSSVLFGEFSLSITALWQDTLLLERSKRADGIGPEWCHNYWELFPFIIIFFYMEDFWWQNHSEQKNCSSTNQPIISGQYS